MEGRKDTKYTKEKEKVPTLHTFSFKYIYQIKCETTIVMTISFTKKSHQEDFIYESKKAPYLTRRIFSLSVDAASYCSTSNSSRSKVINWDRTRNNTTK